MHATLTLCPAAPANLPALRTDLNIVGESAPENVEARVEVPVSLFLSFGEFLGLLTFSAGLDLRLEEVGDKDLIMSNLLFALLHTTVEDRERFAHLSMNIYRGLLPEHVAHGFIMFLAGAITRHFGIAP